MASESIGTNVRRARGSRLSGRPRLRGRPAMLRPARRGSCGRPLAAAAFLLLLTSGAAWSDEYHTVVRADPDEARRPGDDPTGFSTVLNVRQIPAGAGVAALLQEVPGLRVREAGPGGRQGISLRGTESHQAAVYLDGIRLTSPTGGGVDLWLLDPGHLEQMEVRRGGASARFGSGALGGALILKTPRLRMRAKNKGSVGYGSWNAISAGLLRSGTLGRLRYLVSGSYRQSDGDFSFEDHNGVSQVRRNNDSRVGKLLVKVDRLLSERWQVGAIDDLTIGERGAPGMIYSPCDTARQRDIRNMFALRAARHDTLLPGGTVEMSLYHRLGSFRFDGPCSHDAPSSVRSHDVGIIGRLGLPLPGVGRLDIGLEVKESVLEDLLGNLSEVDPDRLQVDLWAVGHVGLWRGQVVLAPAVRVATSTDHGAAVVPKVGLLVRPLAWTRNSWLAPLVLAGNVGRSYRYPSFQEMYISMDSLRGNPDLEPEDALEGDVGLRWRRGPVSLEAAYFRRQMKNIILFTVVNPFRVEAGNHVSTAAQGVETSLGLKPGVGLSLNAAYTYTHTRSGDPPDYSLPGHPGHRLVARLGWRYPWRGEERWNLRLWTRVTAESSMFLERWNTATFVDDGRVLLGAGGAFTYRWVTLSARGENLLDKRDAVDTMGFPLAPARFFVSVAASL